MYLVNAVGECHHVEVIWDDQIMRGLLVATCLIVSQCFGRVQVALSRRKGGLPPSPLPVDVDGVGQVISRCWPWHAIHTWRKTRVGNLHASTLYFLQICVCGGYGCHRSLPFGVVLVAARTFVPVPVSPSSYGPMASALPVSVLTTALLKYRDHKDWSASLRLGYGSVYHRQSRVSPQSWADLTMRDEYDSRSLTLCGCCMATTLVSLVPRLLSAAPT